MRRIDDIVIHHTATGPDWTAERIRRLHVEERGWNDIGYHFVIEHDGLVQPGRHVKRIGAHAKGHNSHSVGVAVVCDNTRPGREWTPVQQQSLRQLVRTLKIIFPDARVRAHRDLVDTLCPGADIGIFIPEDL